LSLVTRAKAGDITPLEVMLNKIETAQSDKAGYKNIKDALFHFLPAMAQVGINPSGVIKGVHILVNRPSIWENVLDSVVEDGKNPQGSALRIFSNTLTLRGPDLQVFRKLLSLLFLDDVSRDNSLEDMAALLSDLYILHPKEFSQARTAMEAYLNDPRVISIAPSALFRNILMELNGQSGWGSLFGDLLLDPASRRRVISLGYGLAKSGDVTQVSQFMVNLIKTGDFEAFLHFIFDNFSSPSLTSK
jgi:hypothetical protein